MEDILRKLPTVIAVMDPRWLRQRSDWMKDFILPRLPWFEQLEQDLGILQNRLNIKRLITCYRNSLQDKSQVQKTMFEIHGASLLASVATKVEIHVPRGDRRARNFDVRAEISGYTINAECKTRKDEFPFNLSPMSLSEIGFSIHEGSRGTLDPHDAASLGMKTESLFDGTDSDHVPTPESTVVRQLLCSGLEQLPTSGYNLIIFGQIKGNHLHLEDALYGTPIFELSGIRPTGVIHRLALTGAFSTSAEGQPFRYLSGVIWVRLWAEDNVLSKAYKLYPNPYADNLLPNDVMNVLKNLTFSGKAIGNRNGGMGKQVVL